MSKLTTAKRNDLPKQEFALPGQRAYPVNDRAHAANAKARATQAVNAGRMSPATQAQIDAKANKVLGKGGDKDDANGKPEPGEGTPREEAQDAKEKGNTSAKGKRPFVPASRMPMPRNSAKKNRATVI